jgi:Family of unknown function (DUF5761)
MEFFSSIKSFLTIEENMATPSERDFYDWKQTFGGPHGAGVFPQDELPPRIVTPQMQNGRVVNVLEPATQIRDYNMYPPQESEDSFTKHALFGIQEPSPLAYYFFSKYNRERLHDRIRYEVYTRSNYNLIISRQSEQELQIIMRAMYLQYALNLNCKYKEQVDDLNTKVIEFAVPQIITEAQQYHGYLRDVQYMPMPMDRPANVSSAGTRTLRSVTTTF